MTGDYLSFLYGLLTTGVSSLSEQFRRAQVDYITSTMQPDGGFRGKQGGSDLYYTDFALRVLSICALDVPDLTRTADFITRWLASPGNIVDAFNALNSARILRSLGYEVPFDAQVIRDCLTAQQMPGGGYSRPGADETSAYNTFLAKLTYDLLNQPMPAVAESAHAIRSLKRRTGGYSESYSEPIPQTSSTAAAITFLMISGHLTPSETAEARRFLLTLQSPTGGLLPCPGAIEPDLLSTFTGLSTMFLTDTLAVFDLPAAARLVKGSIHPKGGFCGCPSETDPDTEYTFYGLGLLALMRLHHENSHT